MFFYGVQPRQLKAHLWEGLEGVPLLVSAAYCWSPASGLRAYARPAQCPRLFVDSGAYSFARKGLPLPYAPAEYIAWCAAMQPTYAAIMDRAVMDPAEVAQCQQDTLAGARALMSHQGGWEWVPVVQGVTAAQFANHAFAYAHEGLDRPFMAIGGLATLRKTWANVQAIVSALHAVLPHTRWHLFGVKMAALAGRTSWHPAIASSDGSTWDGLFSPDQRDLHRAMRRERGWTQRETSVRWALPRYATRLDGALRRPSQLALALQEDC